VRTPAYSIRTKLAAICVTAFFFAGVSPLCTAQSPRIALEPIITDLNRPVFIANADDGSGRLFVVLQAGKIVIFDGQKILPSPFLDITSSVSCCSERGLLSVAFHPNYAANGLLYVNFTDVNGDTVIARYIVADADDNAVNPDSQVDLLQIAQPYSNHNGGQIAFGPKDGFLYIATGDGGSAGDPENRAQNHQSLLGKMLRIDIDNGQTYAIPTDNPFVNDANILDEIWALGLRNPWRFSFDRQTADLFIADVGQSSREEVNFQANENSDGQNYGWRIMEGTTCFNPSENCDEENLTLPIIEYSHTLGCSISGGYRYRGSRIAQLEGYYLYGDFCSGRIWGAVQDDTGAWVVDELLNTKLSISTFGEDEAGEVYVADHSTGTIFLIVERPPPRSIPWVPLLLER